MIRHKLVLLVSVLLLMHCVNFGETLEKFPFFKMIEGKVSPNTLYSVVLDDEIWVHLNENKSNIRLFDDNKNEIPFIIKQKEIYKKIKKRVPVHSQLVSMLQPTDNSIEIMYGFKPGQSIDQLTIKTQVKNFEKKITIYESNTLDSWKFLKNDIIFDYSAIIDHKKLSISVPKTTNKYIKIKIDNVVETSDPMFISLSEKIDLRDQHMIQYRKSIYKKSFKVDQITFYSSEFEFIPNSMPEIQSMTPSWSAQIINDYDQQITEILVDSVGATLESAVITTEESVYQRPLTIQVYQSETDTWKTILMTTITTDSDNQATIPLKRLNSKYLRFIVEDGDDQPIQIKQFKLKSILYEILFYPDQIGSVSVYFGGGVSIFPTYDIQRYAETQDFILELIKSQSLQMNSVKQNNKDFSSDIKQPIQKSYAFLLNISLFLLVLVLLGVVGVVGKKMESSTGNHD